MSDIYLMAHWRRQVYKMGRTIGGVKWADECGEGLLSELVVGCRCEQLQTAPASQQSTNLESL